VRTQPDRFSSLQRVLHWLMAIMVLAMLFIGVSMVSTLNPRFLTLISIHKPLGIAILALAVLRLGVRWGPGAPPLPDDLLRVQALEAAMTQQALNMVNQITPYGTLEYAPTNSQPLSGGGFGGGAGGGGGGGGVAGLSAYPGMYMAYTKLNPGLQRLFEQDVMNANKSAQIASLLQKNVAASASQPLDLSWGATEAKLNELNRNTLDPYWNQREEAMAQSLYNQGVSPGSEAYDTAMRNFQQQRSDAYDQMYLQGHQQAISDILAQYTTPINAAAAWQSGGQIAPYQPNLGLGA
jgi:hypothetical protein